MSMIILRINSSIWICWNLLIYSPTKSFQSRITIAKQIKLKLNAKYFEEFPCFIPLVNYQWVPSADFFISADNCWTLQHKSHLATANFPRFLAIPLLNRVTKEFTSTSHSQMCPRSRFILRWISYCPRQSTRPFWQHNFCAQCSTSCAGILILRNSSDSLEFFWFSGPRWVVQVILELSMATHHLCPVTMIPFIAFHFHNNSYFQVSKLVFVPV